MLPIMKTYLSYARLSRKNDESMAIDRQQADNTAKAKQLGWEPIVPIVDEASAWRKRGARPGFNQLIRAITEHTVDGIIVWDIDRMFRRNDELEDMLNALDAAEAAGHNVEVVSSGSGVIDLASSNGRVVARIMVALAGKASDDTSRRIKRAQADMDRDYYGKAPHQAKLLKKAARAIVAGKSLNSIEDIFTNETGLRGGKLRSENIGKMLQTEKMRDVLGDELWVEVRAILSVTTRRHTAKYDYLMTGNLFCGNCGARMAGRNRHRNGKITPHYVCTSFNVERGKCSLIVAAEPVEKLVLAWIQLELEGQAEEIRTSDASVDAAEIDAKIKHLRRSHFIDGHGTYEEWMEDDAELRLQRDTLTVITRTQMTPEVFDKLWSKANLGGRRELIGRFVEGVQIMPVGSQRGRGFDAERVVVVPSGQQLRQSLLAGR